MHLYTTLQEAMGLNSETLLGHLTLGIKVGKVKFVSFNILP